MSLQNTESYLVVSFCKSLPFANRVSAGFSMDSDPFVAIANAIASFEWSPPPASLVLALTEKPKHTLQLLIDSYGLVILVKAGANVKVYSKRKKTNIGKENYEMVSDAIGIEIDTPTTWHRSVIAKPEYAVAGETLMGMTRQQIEDEIPIRLPDDVL